MSYRISRSRFMSLSLLGMVQLATVGCGTILYPERKNQSAGRLDWGVVALDAVGLLFFLVPGVIAFAVDFNNGTIYLPPGGTGGCRRRRSVSLRKARSLPSRHRPSSSPEVIEQTPRDTPVATFV